MGLMMMLLVVVVTMMSSIDAGWPPRMMVDMKRYPASMMFDWKRSSVSCVGSAGKCYNTGECCTGLLCATVDDQYDQNPEIPGYCARGKDLRTCTTWSDCDLDRECVELERHGPHYCLPRKDAPPQVGIRRHQAVFPKQHLGGIGSDCDDNSDCESVNEDGKKLCCQQISMARQGRKRVCDPVSPISVCITSVK